MGTLVHFPKLAELRARTDHDLARILHADLDRSLALANVAASRRSVFRAQAESVYQLARTLLPKLSGASANEIAELETKLKELGMALDLCGGDFCAPFSYDVGLICVVVNSGLPNHRGRPVGSHLQKLNLSR
ncbi:MAG: hypothetical protein ABSC93_31245 [Bryobacteraceae bacterium]|jgi:hypothetical protein